MTAARLARYIDYPFGVFLVVLVFLGWHRSELPMALDPNSVLLLSVAHVRLTGTDGVVAVGIDDDVGGSGGGAPAGWVSPAAP